MEKARNTAMLGLKVLVPLGLCLILLAAIRSEYQHAVLTTLNYFMPDSYRYLYEIEKDSRRIQGIKLEEYSRYYQKLARHKPQLSEGHELSGFCYFYSGDNLRAIVSFRRALELNPNIYWYHANLGIVLFKSGDYRQAIEALRQALKAKPAEAIAFLVRSKTYRDVLADAAYSDVPLEARADRLYRAVYQLLVLSYYRSGDMQNAFGCAREAYARLGDPDQFFQYFVRLSAVRLQQSAQGLSTPPVSLPDQFDGHAVQVRLF